MFAERKSRFSGFPYIPFAGLVFIPYLYPVIYR